MFEERRFDPDLASKHLKVCVLCGNLLTKTECACNICGWTGPFLNTEAEIRDALIRIFGRADTAAIDAPPEQDSA